MTIGEELDAELARLDLRLDTQAGSIAAHTSTFESVLSSLQSLRDRLDSHAARLTTLEGLHNPSDSGSVPVDKNTEPPAAPNPGGTPRIDTVDGIKLPDGFTPRVELPDGPVGCAHDAETIPPPGNLDGLTLINKRIVIPADWDRQWVARNGDLYNCTIENPHRVPVGNWLKDGYAKQCVFDGVNGDAFKAGQDETVHVTDTYVRMDATGGDKHYDGAQIFRTGHGRLERVVIDWNNTGTVGHTTGAIFTHDQASLYARDITVLNPGGTNELVELHGTGSHDVARVHVWGERALNWQFDKLWPSRLLHITNGTVIAHLYNDVPGATDE